MQPNIWNLKDIELYGLLGEASDLDTISTLDGGSDYYRENSVINNKNIEEITKLRRDNIKLENNRRSDLLGFSISST